MGGNSVEMSDYPRRASLVDSFGGEDVLTTCLLVRSRLSFRDVTFIR